MLEGRHYHTLVSAAHPARIMFWENNPLSSTTQRLSDSGVTSITFQTIANMPGEGDYLSMMRNNANRLESILD